jgi:hypothetical protein
MDTTTTIVIWCVTGIICDTGPSEPAPPCLTDACHAAAGIGGGIALGLAIGAFVLFIIWSRTK